MIFHEYHKFSSVFCISCGHFFDVPVYCGSRFCTICSGKRRARVRKRIDFLRKEFKPRKGVTLKLFTLTIRSESDLKKMIKHLSDSFRKVRNTKHWKNAVFGGVFVFEIKGRPGQWHAHIHGIMESYYFDWNMLRRLWKKASGAQGVDIRWIPAGNAVTYITKYISKPSVPDNCLDEVNKALKGNRLFQPFGTWYAINRKFVDNRPGCPKCHVDNMILAFEVGRAQSYWQWGTDKVITPVETPEDDQIIYSDPRQSNLFSKALPALKLSSCVKL